MELWATYTFDIDGKEISIVAKDYETVRLKVYKKYNKLFA